MPNLLSKYDVIIIGSGSAGHACAVRCADLGLKVLCLSAFNGKQIDQHYSISFENLSIIALLESAKLYECLTTSINKHGIYIENIGINLSEMMDRKNRILEDINKSILNNFTKHNVDFVHSSAELLNTNTVKIHHFKNSPKNIQAEYIVLATDSIPISLPFAQIDNNYILDSTSALNIHEIPKSIAILGGGIIGLEIAGIWNRLGSQITILEAQDSFLNVTDHHISSAAYQIFTEQGLEIRLGTRVISTKLINKKVVVEFQDNDGIHAIKVDKLIVASGRKPNSANLFAPESNLLLDENGFVHTNEIYKTNLPNVFAIGDLTMHGPMLCHKGIAEANFVAEKIAGKTNIPINYNTIPNVIYTEPEIAWVGQPEQSLKSMGHSVKTASYSMNNNFRAKANNKTDGIIKIITKTDTDEILSIHVIGYHASEIIAEAALAIEFSGNCEDFSRAIHSHPSLSEVFFELGYSIR